MDVKHVPPELLELVEELETSAIFKGYYGNKRVYRGGHRT